MNKDEVLETTNEEVTMLSDESDLEECHDLDQSESGTYINGNDLSGSDFQCFEKDNYKEQETFLKMQDEKEEKEDNNNGKDKEINEINENYEDDGGEIIPSQTVIKNATTTTTSSNTTSTPSLVVLSSEDPPHISFSLSPTHKPFNYYDSPISDKYVEDDENKNNDGNILPLSLDNNDDTPINNYYEMYGNNNVKTFDDSMLDSNGIDEEIHNIDDNIYSVPDIPSSDPTQQTPTTPPQPTTTTTTTSTTTKTNLNIDSSSKEFNLFSSPIQLNKTKIILKNKILFKCRFILTKLSKPLDLKEKKYQLRIQQLAYVLLENRGKIQFIRGGRIILHLRVHNNNSFNKNYIVSDKYEDVIHICENKLTFYIQYM